MPVNYTPLTKKQLMECFRPYREAFPDWSVEYDVMLTRSDSPLRQIIDFQSLQSGSYRPVMAISILLPIPDGCSILHRQLDVRHRQVSAREHPTKWPFVLKAMEEQFLPSIRKPLDLVESLRLGEEEAERDQIENTNYTTGLAALNAYVGNRERSLDWCNRIEKQLKTLGREPAAWESRKGQFVRELRQAIELGKERDFLTSSA